MTPTPCAPVFGQAYNIGWIGFTRCSGPISDAIAYGSRWQRAGDPEVTHALVAIGPDACVEAQLGQGVILAPLSKYFNDATAKIYFRQPTGWTPELGKTIAARAESKVGCGYDDLAIVEEAASDTMLGHLINEFLRDKPHEFLAQALANPKEFICSVLAAFALGLPKPAQFSPQQLIGLDAIFAPFINDCSKL